LLSRFTQTLPLALAAAISDADGVPADDFAVWVLDEGEAV
jgi:hypothetical protein